MTNEHKPIQFIAKISKSGSKRLINIPSDSLKKLSRDDEYYKVYLIPIRFNDLEKERI